MLELIRLNPLDIREPRLDLASWFLGAYTPRLYEKGGEYFSPKVDVKESEGAYLVTAELPGVAKDEIKVEVENGRLTLHAEIEEKKDEDNGKYHVRERLYGSFRRVFTLPDNADAGKIEATNKDGILTITIPKAEETKPKAIEVH
ncbi:MAG: Hsp20/alpha crystallin family protein [Pseudomonadota bacterium]